MDFIGTGDDDIFDGTDGKDFFDMSQGGNDRVAGGDGHDTFYFGATLTADDRIDGGGSADVVILKGDYSAGVVFTETTMTSISQLKLERGFSYNFTLASRSGGHDGLKVQAKIGKGQTLTLDSSKMLFDGVNVYTNAGHNNLTGGIYSDHFYLGKTFNAANEHIDGGGGSDVVVLEGKYAPLTFDAVTAEHVVRAAFQFAGNFDYDIVVASSFAAAGETRSFSVDHAHGLTVDASASAANIAIYGTAFSFSAVMGSGDDSLTSVQGTVDFTHGGNDRVSYNVGKLVVNMGDSFTAEDSLHGNNIMFVNLDGDYSAGVTFNATTMVDVTKLILAGGHSYGFTTADTSGGLIVDATGLGENDHLFFDGSAETGSGFKLHGGAGTDTLIGGANGNFFFAGNGADVITGGAGVDRVDGGGGHDVIDISDGGEDQLIYNAATDSSMAYDTVIGFHTRDDTFVMPGQVTAIDDTVAGGRLDGDQGTKVFGDELSATLDASHLHAHHAVLFTPDSGSLAGSVFLVVDQNGMAGFQRGEDIVIKLEGSIGLDLLSKSDFLVH